MIRINMYARTLTKKSNLFALDVKWARKARSTHFSKTHTHKFYTTVLSNNIQSNLYIKDTQGT